jgi:hypothetical protein
MSWLNAIVGVYDEGVLAEVENHGLGVAGRLKERFPDCKIYAEDDVKQGLEAPCFFIKDLDYADSKITGNRYQMHYSLVVHYFPESNTGKRYTEIRKMIPLISDAVEYIKVLDPENMNVFQMSGTIRSADETDGVLQLIVHYNTFFRKPLPEEPIMNYFTHTSSLKN